ncbi:MAG: hemolysin XhlA family protein [Spirochaetes bacterium]|nr:hemolysin XhlA family protein [Spirochaetota bacterium]
MNDCKDCVYIDTLSKRVLELENISKDMEKRLKELETSSKVSEKEIKMIFNILNEIKDSIKQIAEKIDEIEKKPSQNWQTIVTALITGAVAFLLSQVLK